MIISDGAYQIKDNDTAEIHFGSHKTVLQKFGGNQ